MTETQRRKLVGVLKACRREVEGENMMGEQVNPKLLGRIDAALADVTAAVVAAPPTRRAE